jgi:anti-anti-sigma factor
MPKFIILVKYTDSLNRKGTARLQVKASDSESARKKAAIELAEIEKFSKRKEARTFDLGSIQVVTQRTPQKQEGLLISRNNVRAGVEVWELRGTIDASTNKQFDDLVAEAKMEGTNKIVFDFRGIEYINSSGIGTIVSANSEMSVKLANLPQKILEIFSIVGLDSLLDIYYTVEEALEDF